MIASESSRYQQIAVLFADWSSVQSIIIKKEKKNTTKIQKKNYSVWMIYVSRFIFGVISKYDVNKKFPNLTMDVNASRLIRRQFGKNGLQTWMFQC